MGIVDVVSEYCSLPRTRRHIQKRKQFQTVEMKVKIDCEGCERKVKKALDGMKGTVLSFVGVHGGISGRWVEPSSPSPVRGGDGGLEAAQRRFSFSAKMPVLAPVGLCGSTTRLAEFPALVRGVRGGAMVVVLGVSSVDVEAKQSKVTVTGYVDAAKVIRRLAYKTGKRVEAWPYVPYDTVAHPYAPGAYDKRAPAGYVRNVISDPSRAPLARASSTETRYTAAFSDENPNACSVM